MANVTMNKIFYPDCMALDSIFGKTFSYYSKEDVSNQILSSTHWVKSLIYKGTNLALSNAFKKKKFFTNDTNLASI